MATSSHARPSTGHAERQHLNPPGNLAPVGRVTARQLDDWIELLARISHELRTPLNAVIGFSEAMKHEVFGPLGHARYQEYATHIRDSGDLLLRAAEDTLAMTSLLAAPQSMMLAELALAPLVETAVAESALLAAQCDIEIACAVAADIEVQGDSRALPRALRHMIAAALVRAVPASRLRIASVAEQGRVSLTVSLELPAGHAGDARPTATSLRHERGLGREELPLRLARALMDLHGETVWTEHDDSGWSIRTALNQAVQADFFAVRKG